MGRDDLEKFERRQRILYDAGLDEVKSSQLALETIITDDRRAAITATVTRGNGSTKQGADDDAV